MLDHHCHLLPETDDGPSTLEESLEMARILFRFGFTEICCTPHCMKGVYDSTAESVRRAVSQLQESLESQKIGLKLHPGMEYYLDEFFPEHLNDPLPLGETDLLLMEAPVQADPEAIKEYIFQTKRKGLTPLLAHPERNPVFEEQKGTIFRRVFKSPPGNDPLFLALDAMGCLFQANAGSFTGIYGRQVRTQAIRFIKQGRYTHFGTDAHNAGFLEEVLPRTVSMFGKNSEIEKREKAMEKQQEEATEAHLLPTLSQGYRLTNNQ